MARAKVAIVMGSESDLETMAAAEQALQSLGVAYELQIVSAHRTPDHLVEFAKSAKVSGFHVVIAGAGGAAHLPGMVAAMTSLPVIGVPVQSKALNGLDSLLSIVQMPSGIPVATVAIGGAYNAGLLAAQIVALNDAEVAARVDRYRHEQTTKVMAANDRTKRTHGG